MTEFEKPHPSKKSRIIVLAILSIVIIGALHVALSPATIEQQKAFSELLIGLLALAIGIMLFGLYRKFPTYEQFLDSMTILILFMAPVGLSVPLLIAYHIDMYFLLPIYLACLHVWLFFVKHIIYGKNNWKTDPTKKWVLVPWYLLMGVFFAGAIALVFFAPYMPNWISTGSH